MNFIKVKNDITGYDELINLDQITRIAAKYCGWFTWKYEIYFGDNTPAVMVSDSSKEKPFKAIGTSL